MTTPLGPTHGYNRYGKYGCRCDTCCAANTERQRRNNLRRRKDPSAADRAGHGKTGTYNNYGCRCEPCTTAHSAACARLRTRA